MQAKLSHIDNHKNTQFPTTYREIKIGNTLYRITSVYKGEIQLKDALEDLAVRRALQESMEGKFE